MVMEAKGVSFPETPVCEVYFASMGEAAARRCFTLTTKLRQGGVAAECDTVGRSLKAQMKYADKIGARYTLVVGDDRAGVGHGAAEGYGHRRNGGRDAGRRGCTACCTTNPWTASWPV